jgi:hypothetical protein
MPLDLARTLYSWVSNDSQIKQPLFLQVTDKCNEKSYVFSLRQETNSCIQFRELWLHMVNG